jgi:hypothetical protein
MKTFYNYLLVILLIIQYVYACNLTLCGTAIGICAVSCACTYPACECCAECAGCFGDLWIECCECVNLCDGRGNSSSKASTTNTNKPITLSKTEIISNKTTSVHNYPVNITEKPVEFTTTKMCFQAKSSNLTVSPCQTSHGCGYCADECRTHGYGWMCCNGSECCCYQEPAYCAGCNGNQCLT